MSGTFDSGGYASAKRPWKSKLPLPRLTMTEVLDRFITKGFDQYGEINVQVHPPGTGPVDNTDRWGGDVMFHCMINIIIIIIII